LYGGFLLPEKYILVERLKKSPCENDKENLFFKQFVFLLVKITRRILAFVVGLDILQIKSSPLSALAT